MLFVYECTENIIAEFKKFYDTQLSEEQKKRIFVPTYDCMKKYQGSWHMEQKPAFRNCFLIECRDRDDLADMLHRLQCADILAENITANAITLGVYIIHFPLRSIVAHIIKVNSFTNAIVFWLIVLTTSAGITWVIDKTKIGWYLTKI